MSSTTKQLSSSSTMALVRQCHTEKDSDTVARSSALAEIITERETTAWVKVTKGRVYDFDFPNKPDGTPRVSGEYRKFLNVDSAEEIDCVAFLMEEMA